MTENRKRALLLEQSESGLSQSEFCRQKGIANSSFTTWKQKYGVFEKESNGKFISVSDDDSVEISFPSGIVVRVSASIDSATLSSLRKSLC